VTYGAVEGPAKTFTRDFSEEGLFLFTDRPLPETSQIHMLVTIPGRAQPLSVMGKVSHTILGGDEAPPGMGVIFEVDDAQRADLVAVVTELEQKRAAGEL
jgi:Tfp pilus assembly protein PilZ